MCAHGTAYVQRFPRAITRSFCARLCSHCDRCGADGRSGRRSGALDVHSARVDLRLCRLGYALQELRDVAYLKQQFATAATDPSNNSANADD